MFVAPMAHQSPDTTRKLAIDQRAIGDRDECFMPLIVDMCVSRSMIGEVHSGLDAKDAEDHGHECDPCKRRISLTSDGPSRLQIMASTVRPIRQPSRRSQRTESLCSCFDPRVEPVGPQNLLLLQVATDLRHKIVRQRLGKQGAVGCGTGLRVGAKRQLLGMRRNPRDALFYRYSRRNSTAGSRPVGSSCSRVSG